MIVVLLVAALNCGKTATQLDLDFCSERDARAQIAVEARTYRETLQRFPHPADQQSLRNAENLWTIYRRTFCDFSGGLADGGSIRPLVDNTCVEELTRDRTSDLARFTGVTNPSASISAPAQANEEMRIYGLLELLVSPADRGRLGASERAWVAYRSAACERARDDCATEMTAARTKALKNSWLAEPFW